MWKQLRPKGGEGTVREQEKRGEVGGEPHMTVSELAGRLGRSDLISQVVVRHSRDVKIEECLQKQEEVSYRAEQCTQIAPTKAAR